MLAHDMTVVITAALLVLLIAAAFIVAATPEYKRKRRWRRARVVVLLTFLWLVDPTLHTVRSWWPPPVGAWMTTVTEFYENLLKPLETAH